MRQQLGDSWLGATPKCESTSQKKGSSGTRIPASSASAYKQMEPAGGGEHARRSPAGIGVNAFVLTPNFSQRAWTDFWLRRYEATRSVAGHERAFPPPPPSSSRSLESAVVSWALAGLGSMVWTEDKEWEAEEEGMPQLQGWPGLVLDCWWGGKRRSARRFSSIEQLADNSSSVTNDKTN